MAAVDGGFYNRKLSHSRSCEPYASYYNLRSVTIFVCPPFPRSFMDLRAPYLNLTLVSVCLFQNSSGIYGSTGTKCLDHQTPWKMGLEQQSYLFLFYQLFQIILTLQRHFWSVGLIQWVCLQISLFLCLPTQPFFSLIFQ